MKKYFLIAALFSCFYHQSFSQFSEARRIDSLRLDSVKRLLPFLKDSARVNALNTISSTFAYFSPDGGFKYKIDSMLQYASKAYNEAKNIGYKSGIATALISLTGAEISQNLAVKDEPAKEKNILESIQLADAPGNSKVLGRAYSTLALFPSARNDLKKRISYLKRAVDYFNTAKDTLGAGEVTNWLTAGYLENGDYEKSFEYG